eukprot:Awhi_evm1s11493
MPYNVCVVGAGGGIGQPLSLLMKNNTNVKGLSLYDVAPIVAGVAADLSHINTPAKVSFQVGMEGEKLRAALKDADIVVIPAGVPRKPGMSRDDLFKINAGIVRGIAEGVADACPNAIICVISNPVNSTVPIFVDTLAKKGVDASSRVFGVSTLDIVRSNAFVAEMKGLDVNEVNVPVVGGHSGVTIVPLLSRVTPQVTFTDDELKKLSHRIQNAGTEVVEAKAGAGSATLSMAYAGARFVNSVMRACDGEKVVECTYVKSNTMEGVEYFASPVTLGPKGVVEIHPVGDITSFEQTLLSECVTSLKSNIAKAVEFCG